MQGKRTWLPDSEFAHVPAKVPVSGVSPELLDLLATFSTCLLFLCSAKKCVHRQHPFSARSTGSTASRENTHFFQVIPSAKRHRLLYSHLNFIVKTRLFHIQQEQQLQITCTFTDSAPSSPEKSYLPQGLSVWGLVGVVVFFSPPFFG